MLEELKKYLSETPTKQIAEEWEELTKDATCNAPTIEELFNTWDRVYKNESIDLVSYRYLDDGETAEIGDEYWFGNEWMPVEKQYFPYVFRTRGFYKHRRKSNGS